MRQRQCGRRAADDVPLEGDELGGRAHTRGRLRRHRDHLIAGPQIVHLRTDCPHHTGDVPAGDHRGTHPVVLGADARASLEIDGI